jgi:hypothetical protein
MSHRATDIGRGRDALLVRSGVACPKNVQRQYLTCPSELVSRSERSIEPIDGRTNNRARGSGDRERNPVPIGVLILSGLACVADGCFRSNTSTVTQ